MLRLHRCEEIAGWKIAAEQLKDYGKRRQMLQYCRTLCEALRDERRAQQGEKQ